MKSCCVTGHRDIPNEKIDFIETKLREEIKSAIDDGFTLFISGFAPGVDMIFAKIIVGLQVEYPHIHLEAALPYPTWLKNRNASDKSILSKCVAVGVHSPKYHANCFLVRNRFMVNTCERVIAVYDGREKGGTVQTMRYAAVLERDFREIRI